MKQHNTIKNIISTLFVTTIITFSSATLAWDAQNLTSKRNVGIGGKRPNTVQFSNWQSNLLQQLIAAQMFNNTEEDKNSVLSYARAAEQGEAQAQYTIGIFYYRIGGKFNSEQALKWFDKAANQGHPEATQFRSLFR